MRYMTEDERFYHARNRDKAERYLDEAYDIAKDDLATEGVKQ